MVFIISPVRHCLTPFWISNPHVRLSPFQFRGAVFYVFSFGTDEEEQAIINVIKNNPTATQKQIAEATGKSERTIKRRTVEMQEKGLISRENGKRNGKWIVQNGDRN